MSNYHNDFLMFYFTNGLIVLCEIGVLVSELACVCGCKQKNALQEMQAL